MPENTELKKYKQHIVHKLEALSPVFAKAAIGDFSGTVVDNLQDEELGVLFAGVQLMLETIREKIAELELASTEAKANSAIMANQKARDEAILESLTHGLITVDNLCNVTYANQPAAGLLGEHVLILGQDARSMFPLVEGDSDELVPAASHPITVAISRGERIVANLTNRHQYYLHVNQRKFRVSFTITPIKRSRKITGAAVMFRDLTEEANLDQTKTDIISIASHQLRTPLVTVKWYASGLIEPKIPLQPQQQKQYIQQIYDANQRMIDLVDRLLNVSNMDLGILTIKPEVLSLEAILQIALKDLAPQIQDKLLVVLKHIEKPLGHIVADKNFMQAILQNLLANAIKYSFPKRQIIVTMRREADNILIAVQDTGVGIPEGSKSRIFTKLFRADNARMMASDGSGLGLYTVKAMVERSGGKIWFESVENQGSTFYVTMPTEH
jgi:signal transduction histidine kinase